MAKFKVGDQVKVTIINHPLVEPGTFTGTISRLGIDSAGIVQYKIAFTSPFPTSISGNGFAYDATSLTIYEDMIGNEVNIELCNDPYTAYDRAMKILY